jgi:signal transduction histidine kinase/CheY-like chemotaxis protein
MYLSYSQDDKAILNKIDSINTQALRYYNNNKIMQSINSFNYVIKLSDSIEDNYGKAVANFSLGKIYHYMKEYKVAERYYTKMLNASTKVHDNYLLANSYSSLGEIYKNEGQISKVIPFYKEALLHAKKSDVKDQFNTDKRQEVLFNVRMGLISTYLDIQQPKNALTYLLRAEENTNKYIFVPYNEALLSYLKGRYFIQKEAFFKASNKFEEAMEFLEDDGISESLKENMLITKIYKEYSESLAQTGNNQKAYAILLKYNNLSDVLTNNENIKQESIAKSKFSIAEYKREARIAKQEILLQSRINDKMQQTNLITIGAVFFLFASLLVLYRIYIAKRKSASVLKVRNIQLEIAKNEAVKSSQLKSNFISNVTHELRTPLYGVVGLTSLLLKSNSLNDRDSKYLKSLKFSGDYLLNLINDVLQFGKIESEEIKLHNTTVDIKKLIENIIDSFEYRIQESNNEIHLSIDDNLPKFVKCDNVRLSQTLINLIGNSIKFTQNGKVWIQIEVINFVKEGVKIRFAIKDNGPGIAKKEQKIIFENFSQLNEVSNTNYQGTGLGLSISKKLVELFGGKITLVSEIGKGAEFSFDIDLEIDNNPKTVVENKKVYGKTITLEDKCKILVAEDNKINQIVTKNILKKGNFECDIVENGLEAINAIKTKNYDLILMDINMPIMSGTDATKKIRKFNSNIPIIALTAADIDEVKKDFSEIGFNDIITKPFDNFEFHQIITKNIYRSRQRLSKKLFKVS